MTHLLETILFSFIFHLNVFNIICVVFLKKYAIDLIFKCFPYLTLHTNIFIKILNTCILYIYFTSSLGIFLEIRVLFLKSLTTLFYTIIKYKRMHSGKKSELPKTFYVTYYKSMLPK